MAAGPLLRHVFLSSLLLAAACSGSSQPPTGPAATNRATLTSIQVGSAGNASTIVPPGQTLQLWALAKYSDSTSSDVTNLAVWQSSDPLVATVSPEGILRAAAEGQVDVTATYLRAQGAIHAIIRKPGCEATTVSPGSLTFDAFSRSSGVITVTTVMSDCYWTAKSDAPWLNFTYNPGRSGTGTFSYSVPNNNYPDSRTAHIVVAVSGGTELTHTVTQTQPVSCSYVLTPDEKDFSAGGGSGFFDVITTPSDCRWTARSRSTFYGVQLTGAASGTGAGRVTYSVAPHTRTNAVSALIEVAGLSGANPPGTHTVHIAAR